MVIVKAIYRLDSKSEGNKGKGRAFIVSKWSGLGYRRNNANQL